jgi:hypothetical protein
MRKIATLFFSGLAFLGVAAIGCNGYDQETFTAQLAGTNEVPASGVAATGTFSVVFDGPAAKYSLTTNGLAAVSAAHIHTGATGANGGIWVFLYDNAAGVTKDFASGEQMGTRSFTQDMVAACTVALGCVAGGSYDAILTGARASTVYVNIHTTANPGGAIRGQIHP